MGLFKNVDQKIMKRFPSIWETKVHVFLPIVLIILALGFIIGYAMEPGSVDDNGIMEFIPLLIVPSIVLLVFWIISAVKYNVFKSGGKSTIAHDYMHFIIYFMMFISVSQIPFSPMYGYHMKLRSSYDKEAIMAEQEVLNKGYTVLSWNRYDVDEEGIGNYSIRKQLLVNDDFNYRYYDYTSDAYIMDRAEMIRAVDEFKIAVYKLTGIQLDVQSDQYVDLNIETNFSNSIEYNDDVQEVESYFRSLQRFGSEALPEPFDEREAWLLLIGLSSMASWLFWMFKRNSTREFFFGIIAIAATPAIVGLLSLFIFSILDNYRGEDETMRFIFGFGLIIYGVLALVFGYQRKQKHWLGVLSSMAFNFYLPLNFFIICAITFDNYESRRNLSSFLGLDPISNNEMMEFFFWTALILGLLIMIPMKAIYKKQWFLPAKK